MGMIRVLDDSFVCNDDLSALADQFRPVKLVTTAKNRITVCTAATDPVYGIVQDKPKVGDAAQVAIFGRYFAKVDGSGTAIAIGDYLGVNAAGTMLVKKATADFGVCARALDVCTFAGGIIDVLLFAGMPTFFRTVAG
jgi:hypothetical protein